MIDLVEINEYFEIHNGITKSSIIVEASQINEHYIPYIRPSQSYENSVDGYVDKRNIKNNKIFPPYTMYISTDGEGSHSYSYLSSFEFVPNSNVIALKEKIPLKVEEKLFYANCITNNRFKFSYSRKPKEERISSLLIPSKDSIPDFVYKQKINSVSKKALLDKKTKLGIEKWKIFYLKDIFKITRGQRLIKEDRNNGQLPYFSASEINNGCTDFISNPIFIKKNAVIYTTFGDAFYVETEFTASDEISILQNQELNKYNGLFIATVMQQNKYKYAFGRKAFYNKLIKDGIKLPATIENLPDWQFMENYIKSLPYSSSL